ncbi:MAG: copper chaperone PCu(A)C [Proteobacteria bacterium]|nr:copper chaperone PCu(A)C [Pseudomonadota bacterium]
MTSGVTVIDAWARPPLTPTGAGAVYLTVVNKTSNADRLVGVKTNAANRAQLHTHILTDGIARMRRVDGIPLKAGGTIKMKPGGFHVMLMRPAAAIKEGAHFALTLVFERAGEVEVQVQVRNATASGTGGHDAHGK